MFSGALRVARVSRVLTSSKFLSKSLPLTQQVRSMGGHGPEPIWSVDPSWFDSKTDPVENPLKPGLVFPPKLDQANAPSQEEFASGAVKIPILVDSLEWMLSSPPPLHQFDEPPIIVEFPVEN